MSRTSTNRYYDNVREPLKRPWYEAHRLTKGETITLNRVRSSHMATRRKLREWGLGEDDKCTRCGEPEDLDHVLYDCTQLEDLRRDHPFEAEHHTTWMWRARTEKLRELTTFIAATGVKV
jgi:hypothetical protein